MAHLTPRAQQVLALARKEADRFYHNFVGTEHVLLGLIKLGQGVAVNVLRERGLDLESVRKEVERQVGVGPEQKVIGIIPYTFTVSSHLIVTVALALLVFFIVLFYGFYKNGLKFFKLFVPSGVPIYILPLVVFIEVISFFLKPVSHSVRLFANMLAGHIALKVFASFIGMLGAVGFIGWVGAVLPLGLTIALTALELLVAFLQAYVFAILTCIYLNDAIHPGH